LLPPGILPPQAGKVVVDAAEVELEPYDEDRSGCDSDDPSFDAGPVIEYDFETSIVPVRALLPIESNDGATIGADGIVLLDDPYEYDIDWAVLADETLDKYEELLSPVSTLFTSAFGDQLVIEYDLLVGVPIPVLGVAPCVAAVIEY
jgi:hypothetical protein